MKCDHQRGTSTLAAVATLFSLGLFLLSALHRQLDNIQHITAEEQHHLRAFNQAASSLNWGVGQRWLFSMPWLASSTWHCNEHLQYGLKACLKPASLPGFFILKGESQSSETLSPRMLYQRVKLHSSQGARGEHRLVKVAHGWSDFCPDKDAKFCL
ncbi:YgdB family protein [Yersinia rochesterensis]|uniref:YgdB family protein n=1 Tax=Yersinia rochesterensis TaxID=1604335 RepID=UPI0025AA67DC|nr:YgdB family protein [Yersinia rochesterensis]MDN0106865.1 YgdB family protein [Yersinia rochesterensis]